MIATVQTRTVRLRATVLAAALLAGILWIAPNVGSCQESAPGPPLSESSAAGGLRDWFAADDSAGSSLIIRAQNGLPVRPNVRNPGTDFSDYPNSSRVVPVGEFYLSLEWDYMVTDAPRITQATLPYTFRMGLIEDVEIRATGNGLTQSDGPNFNETGFSPVSFGFKWHLLDGWEERYLPGVGLEADVSTRLASDFFDPGRAIPDFSFNFDQPLPGDWSLSWNTGVTWQVDDNGDQFAQWNLPWSLVYAFNDDFEMYWHGLFNLPDRSAVQQELLTGVGFNLYIGNQWSLWGNYNWGFTDQSDFQCVVLGVTYAGLCPRHTFWHRGG